VGEGPKLKKLMFKTTTSENMTNLNLFTVLHVIIVTYWRLLSYPCGVEAK